ncbi:hypothetical protein [Mycobacterium sp.]|uniref:hypothetical protein n=1 Tax=Mycobacterium sp. TaxID=1785 RepID=UPI0031CE7F82
MSTSAGITANVRRITPPAPPPPPPDWLAVVDVDAADPPPAPPPPPPVSAKVATFTPSGTVQVPDVENVTE